MDLDKVAAKAKGMLPPKPVEKKEEVKKPESKDAGAGSSPEIKKVEEKKIDLEAQAKKDEEILSKKEEDLDEGQKTRKAELVKVKQDAEGKSNVQKRFDELTAQIKNLEKDSSSTKVERDSLRKELDDIKKQISSTPEDEPQKKLQEEVSARRKKFLEEDVKLPKERRREMTKAELDEWAMEDYEAAQEWITKRTLRRVREEDEIKTDHELTKKANSILDKQLESAKRTYGKHPELDIHARQAQLKKEGKSKQEIFDTLCKEVPKYKLGADIIGENPEKYLTAENGPELVVEEIEKRLGKTSSKGEEPSEVEKLKAKLAELEADNARLKGLDTGITSSRQADPQKVETDIEKKQAELALKVGLDPKRLKDRVAERVKQGYDG